MQNPTAARESSREWDDGEARQKVKKGKGAGRSEVYYYVRNGVIFVFPHTPLSRSIIFWCLQYNTIANTAGMPTDPSFPKTAWMASFSPLAAGGKDRGSTGGKGI
ncbi:hypothetical protein WAI453_008105 [Rhynchosporium graminicola]